ncbi:MAG TPA: hypothetical protein VHI99_12950 [Vicinamibacterales bacterium]|nr:hypothetical protein [Vicinamibacterales bacterium]
MNGDQVVSLMNATIGVDGKTVKYEETFTPAASSPAVATCNLPPATILVTRLTDNPTGAVNETDTIQPKDDDSVFRVVDCKYMYNLATASLPGPGKYRVEAIINGKPAGGVCRFRPEMTITGGGQTVSRLSVNPSEAGLPPSPGTRTVVFSEVWPKLSTKWPGGSAKLLT